MKKKKRLVLNVCGHVFNNSNEFCIEFEGKDGMVFAKACNLQNNGIDGKRARLVLEVWE